MSPSSYFPSSVPSSPAALASPVAGKISYPPELPVSQQADEIAALLAKHQVLIVCGETGSGKTTQLPKICLQIGRGVRGLIGHTQPRRLAATSTAKRIAQELNSPLGEIVGYQVRFQDTLQPNAMVKLMTDGILLAETQHDPLLKKYDTLIIDEAHERSLNIDFLLGYLKNLLQGDLPEGKPPARPDLKLIITSATIDAERFAQHFAGVHGPAPIINVSGRLYPVEVRYRPIQPENKARGAGGIERPGATPTSRANDERDVNDGIVDAVAELARQGAGDILVFLPGEREIREAAEALRKSAKHHAAHTEILPLFARLSAQEQERIFQPSNVRRIVLATNVAETSLTVPGIRYVVDTGLARVKRYSYRNKVEQLQIEPIAQAAANQRAGRCGRVAAGVCIRLYEEADFKLRPAFTDPEILRSSLAAVILRMKALGLPNVEDFPFIEPPSGKAIADGYQLLQELGALDEQNTLTKVGQVLARLPLDPRVARMVLAAREQHCLHEVLIIASALEIQDPRERPLEAQEQADQAHKKWQDDKSAFQSDFMAYLKLWNWFADAVEHKKSQRQLAQTCRDHFVSQLRMREWRDIHSQLRTVVVEQGWRINDPVSSPATYEQIHAALLLGLLGNVANKIEHESHYLAARGLKVHIWPGSALARKAPRWLMAAELVETTRVFARCVARIEPDWIERHAPHLLKKSWSHPHWEKKAEQVIAYERATLYGLTIYQQRRVAYARINAHTASEARTLFIRGALVAGEWESRAPFFAHNRQLVREIEQLEHKSRRQDVLVDDALIEAFYEQRLPASVCDARTFEQWRKEAERSNPKLLYLNREELMRHEAAGVTTEAFPKQLVWRGLALQLNYHFEPGSARDGVTLTLPLAALNQLDQQRCEWLVPGLLKEKVQQLLKSLPQKIRRHCVPLPEYAAQFAEQQHAVYEAQRQVPGLLDTLIADIRQRTQQIVKPTDFKLETIPAHLLMNLCVVDEHGRQLGMGRNLAGLRAELGHAAQQAFQKMAAGTLQAGLQAALRNEKVELNGQGSSMSSDTSLHASTHSNDSGDGASGLTAASDLPSLQLLDNVIDWSFEPLPELAEVKRGGQILFGYPALVDCQTHCKIDLFDEEDKAQQMHHLGVRRLFALQLREPIKYLEKNLPDLQTMGMLYMPLGSVEELRQQLIEAALERACMMTPLPSNTAEFAERLQQGRTRLNLLAQELARQTLALLQEYTVIQKKLPLLKLLHTAANEARQDMTQQLNELMGKYFVVQTAAAQFPHLLRYLKAMHLRIDKLKAEPVRDQQRMAELRPLLQQYQRTQQQRRGQIDVRLQEFRWLLEELRVSLFAQELRTPMPVSVKRLQKVWDAM